MQVEDKAQVKKTWDEIVWGAWICDPEQGLICTNKECGKYNPIDNDIDLAQPIVWEYQPDWL